MHVEELFAHLDDVIGPGWKARIGDEDVKAAMERWIDAKISAAIHIAIEEMPEEK